MSNSTPADSPDPIIAAANFFSSCARGLLNVDQSIHAETLIASLARMSGSLMYRTFGFNSSIHPGTVVLSDEANTHGPKLMGVVFNTLEHLGDHVSQAELDSQYMSDKHSQLTFLESVDRLAPSFLEYCQENSLPLYDAAMAAAVATALCIHDCQQVLSANKGASIATYGLIEGTKTAPSMVASPAGSTSAPPQKPKKPWYQFW
ncbi:MAG: hypothetical protein IPK50_14480 [Fibrobacterota bacterium]|nr:hypothetical protein [Fibrobacterota bacterium]QQS03503.1 MAG: hypothetical protein IPK50_14480 [Fibrobacterota bacterium]